MNKNTDVQGFELDCAEGISKTGNSDQRDEYTRAVDDIAHQGTAKRTDRDRVWRALSAYRLCLPAIDQARLTIPSNNDGRKSGITPTHDYRIELKTSKTCSHRTSMYIQ